MPNKVLGIEDGSTNSELTLNKQGNKWVYSKTWESRYFVLAQDLNQTDEQVAATTGLPQIGELAHNGICRTLRSQESMRCIHPTTGVATILWIVTAVFDSRIDPDSISLNNPTLIRPKRRWYTEYEKVRVQEDVEGSTIQTAALEPIILEKDRLILVQEIERFEPYPFDPDTIFNFADHVNQSTYYGAPQGTAWMADIQQDEEEVNNTTYERVRYVVKFRLRINPASPSTFLSNTARLFGEIGILNQGYLHINSATGLRETFLIKGQPVKVNLDNLGFKLDDEDDPVFLPYVERAYADFSTLNLEF